MTRLLGAWFVVNCFADMDFCFDVLLVCLLVLSLVVVYVVMSVVACLLSC